jgi:predicted DNA-binding transcriptional regulator YafY
MYSPATRLLTALDILQTHPGLTAGELAERLEVDKRSIRRYVTMLQDLGIPVVSERGRYGGYRLRPGFKLPPLMLTNEEALAVTLGLLAAQRFGLSNVIPSVEGALAKVERVLPQTIREQVQAVQETVMLDLLHSTPAIPPTETAITKHLASLSTAAYLGQRVAMGYQSGDGKKTERDVDCYGLVYWNSKWYVIGYCHLRAEIRVFKLNRVLSVEPGKGRFVRPPTFNCLEYVIQSFAAIPDRWLVEVQLDMTLEQARRSVPSAFATIEERPGATYGALLRAYDRDLGHTARFLLSLGCRFHVCQPPELLTALQQIADEIAHVIEQARATQSDNRHDILFMQKIVGTHETP